MFVRAGSVSTQGVDVVELDDARRLPWGDRGPQAPLPRHHVPIDQSGEALVDGPVVGAIEDEDARASGEQARIAQRVPVGVGRGQRELPPLGAEAPGQLAADDEAVLGREHEGDAIPQPLTHVPDRGGR
jgi:hypothetical protein